MIRDEFEEDDLSGESYNMYDADFYDNEDDFSDEPYDMYDADFSDEPFGVDDPYEVNDFFDDV